MSGSNSFIPFNGVKRQQENLRWELQDTISTVMLSGNLLQGTYKAVFEDEIAARTGREYAICVNSGTNAIHYIFDYLGTQGLNYHLGDWSTTPDIGIPHYSFRATNNTVANRGQIRLIDVDDQSGLIDLQSEQFQKNLDIIMYVNLFGNMINYEELMTVTNLFSDNKDAVIIEDAAQSFGATFKGKPSGSFGDFSIFSFDPTKNFGSSTGGGGMILTDDHAAAGWFFNYLSNGQNNYNFNVTIPTVNSTMSEIDCACMSVKLKHFDKWQERRKEIAKYYTDNLHESIITPDMATTEGVDHAYSKYVIVTHRRDTIKQALKTAGIETKIHYPREETFELNDTRTSNATVLSKNILSLPIYPELTDAEVERIVEEVNKPVVKNIKLMSPPGGHLI